MTILLKGKGIYILSITLGEWTLTVCKTKQGPNIGIKIAKIL
jgi:hypothetical protein